MNGRMKRSALLFLIRTFGFGKRAKYDSGFIEYPARSLVYGVTFAVYNFLDPCVYDHLCAEKARTVCGVECRILDRNTVIRRLDNRVFLAMTAEAFAKRASRRDIRIAPRAAAFVAVLYAARSAVVSRRYYPVIFHDNCRDLTP